MSKDLSKKINWTLGGFAIGLVSLAGTIVFEIPTNFQYFKGDTSNAITSDILDSTVVSDVVSTESLTNNKSATDNTKDATKSINITNLTIESKELYESAIGESDGLLKEKLLIQVNQICQEILALDSKNINIIKRIMFSNIALGEIENDLNKRYLFFDKAKDYAYQAIEINENVKEELTLQYYYAQCTYNMGCNSTGEKSTELLNESLGYFEKLSNFEKFANHYIVTNCRLLYENTKDISYLRRDFDSMLRIDLDNDSELAYEVLKELSDIYYILGLNEEKKSPATKVYFEKSIKCIDKAIKIKSSSYLVKQRKIIIDKLAMGGK